MPAPPQQHRARVLVCSPHTQEKRNEFSYVPKYKTFSKSIYFNPPYALINPTSSMRSFSRASINPVPRIQYLFNGKLVESSGSTTFPVTCPATGTVLACTPQNTASELEACAESSAAAFKSWSRVPPQQRSRVNFKLAELIRARTEDVARLITAEQGKTLGDARGDVFRGLEVVEYACSVPAASLGSVAPLVGPHMETASHRLPLGVCAGIFAFNFPAMLPLWGFPLATALGNTYLLKPSERVPSAGLALAAMACEAGLPPGVLNVVQGGHDTVNFLCASPPVQAVSFVGSNPGGEHVFAAASRAGKRVQSNMGAKNHAVLLGDADMGSALGALTGAAFGAAGQRCMALPVVVLVGEARAAVPRMVELASRLRVGPGLDAASDLGPMISPEARARAVGIVDAAVAAGARLLLDGRAVAPPQGCEGGNWMGPTVLHLGSAASGGLRNPAYTEEIFGPVQCILEAETLEEAIGVVNDNAWGNGGAIFTSSGPAAHAFVHGVNIGQVGVNVPIPVPLPVFSFTGNKRSFVSVGAARARAGVWMPCTHTHTHALAPHSQLTHCSHSHPPLPPAAGRRQLLWPFWRVLLHADKDHHLCLEATGGCCSSSQRKLPHGHAHPWQAVRGLLEEERGEIYFVTLVNPYKNSELICDPRCCCKEAPSALSACPS